MNARKIKNSVWFSLLVVVIWACNKDESSTSWSNCSSCNLASWVGSWQGQASVYNANSNETTNGLNATLEITETGTQYISISISIPNQYASTVSGELLTGYSVSFAGSNHSFTGTLFEKKGKLKITGTAKKFHYKVNELVIESVVNLEVIPTKKNN